MTREVLAMAFIGSFYHLYITPNSQSMLQIAPHGLAIKLSNAGSSPWVSWHGPLLAFVTKMLPSFNHP
ncbi:MAG: hypothetical protein ACXAB7_15540 [Candidatus Kariarchaeaceae archaeon]